MKKRNKQPRSTKRLLVALVSDVSQKRVQDALSVNGIGFEWVSLLRLSDGADGGPNEEARQLKRVITQAKAALGMVPMNEDL